MRHILIFLFALLLAVSASAQINTGVGIDTDGDGVPDAHKFPITLSEGSSIEFSLSGGVLTITSTGGAISADSTEDGVSDVTVNPAQIRGGSNFSLSYSGGWLILNGGTNCDSVRGLVVDTTGKAQSYVVTYDTVGGEHYELRPVSAGDAYWFRGMPLQDTTAHLQPWYTIKWDPSLETWVYAEDLGATAGTQDSIGYDTGGVAGVDEFGYPVIFKEGANFRMYPGATPDTIYFEADAGLFDSSATDNIFRLDSEGDSSVVITDNDAALTTTVRPGAGQTGGMTLASARLLDASTDGLKINDTAAGLNRTGLFFYGDDMYVEYYSALGSNLVWHFAQAALTADNPATIGENIEWDGNLLDELDMDTTNNDYVVGGMFKITSAQWDSAFVTFRRNIDTTKVIIGDSLDNYVGSVAFTAYDGVIRSAIRDSIEQAANPFTDFEVDSLRGTNLVASSTIECQGDSAGRVLLSGPTAGYTLMLTPDSSGDNYFYWPVSGGVTDTGKYFCLGLGFQTQWRDVPTSWDWADSSSHGPDSVLYADTSAYSRAIDTTGAAFQAYVGNHGAGGFLDTLTNLDSLKWTAETSVIAMVLASLNNTTFIEPQDNDTLALGRAAAKVYVGPPGLTECDSLHLNGKLFFEPGVEVDSALVDSIDAGLGRFSATGSTGTTDTVTIANTAGTDSLSSLAGRIVLIPSTGVQVTLSNDTALVSTTLGTAIVTGEITDGTIAAVDLNSGADFPGKFFDSDSTVADSGMATKYYARDAAGDSAGTRALSTDFAKVTDDTTDWKGIRANIRDTVKVIPISRTIGLMDPANFTTDTVPLIHFDSTAYAAAVTLQRLEFSSPAAATDTIYFWEWADAPGTGSESPVDTLILTAATSVISIEFNDASFARGSWLVATGAKSGNTILMENVTVTFIGGN